MKHLARGVLVVVLLLASVSVVSAECAWVLWGEYGEVVGGDMKMREPRPQEAFPTRTECSTVIANYIAGLARGAAQVAKQGDSWIAYAAPGGEGRSATFRSFTRGGSPGPPSSARGARRPAPGRCRARARSPSSRSAR